MTRPRLPRPLSALLLALLVPAVLPAADPASIASRTVEVDGLELHYLTAGRGEALILLHGYAETSRMWRPVIPVLAERFTVIAPDLPGIGESAIPNDGLDMKTSAAPSTRSRGSSASRRPASSATTSA